MNKPDKHIVVFILKRGVRFLVEERALPSDWAGKLIFPGGSVENHEMNDFITAMKRESMEELGVIPIKFYQILTPKIIHGFNGVIVNPFLVTRWQGKTPKIVLDKGNPLRWVDMETMIHSPIKPVSQIAKAVISYLTSNK